MASTSRLPLKFTLSGEDDQVSLANISLKDYADEANPFNAFTGAITMNEDALSDEAMSPSSMWSSSSRPSSSPSSTSETRQLNANVPARRALVSAHTFPTYRHGWHAAGQGPQEAKETILQLSLMQDQAKTFRLDAPFIYATKTRNIPRYQLQQEVDSNGFVSKLHIRAVLPRETRSLSVPAIHALHRQQIRYSDDETLYDIDIIEMRGRKTGTVPGCIQMTSGKSLWGDQWTRFWHVTKCKAQHHVCDYRGVCEPEKRILYCVKKGVWEDAEGVVVAREEMQGLGSWGANRLLAETEIELNGKGRVFEMTDDVERDGKKRDLVMACWVMKLWMAEELRWEGN
ncbi:hypothetical protein G6011_05047 [Alternaria panax]|uniref:Uncharacterized protein n=1 Tax=Alternaria panax TaxID=48097 RepID=A0AAD4FCQ2_9PLEO|nr:hypothetical protein G6011_05047 [Alternaria panax]